MSWETVFASLLAVQTREEAYKDLVAGARFYEMLGYVLGAVGILVVLAAIPYAYYRDRKKKARTKKLPPDEPDA